MEQKYFLHRIQLEGTSYTKGIEIHDTLDGAVLSFWGRMKLAYGASAITFMHCKITDAGGNAVRPYDMAWNADEAYENKFFMHYIRKDGEAFTKDIDVCDTFDAARSAFAAQEEYGHNNPRHPNVTFVSCEVTDRTGSVMYPFAETWNPPEAEPAAEE